MGLLSNIRSALTNPRRPVSEIIGRVASTSISWINRWRVTPTVDQTRVDAVFWDNARRGKIKGLEFSSPLLKPITSKIAAWTLGQAPQISYENESTQSLVGEWWEDNHAHILEAFEESLSLGDIYLLINADLTITLLPSDIVDPIVDPNDYRKVIGYRVTEVFPNPENPADIMRETDEYYADRRVVTLIHQGRTKQQRTYANLIGRLPIIHICNNRGVGETNGRPEYEALLNLLYEYNDVLKYAIEGNKRQGRPTPVIESMGDAAALDAFWARYGKPYTYIDDEGNSQTGVHAEFDADQLMTLANDAKFKWASPASFMTDVQALLELFFYLIVQHSELPEFIFGTAIASSKASADAQLPSFTKFIEKKQSLAVSWLKEITEIVSGFISLVEHSVQMEVGQIKFVPLTTTDAALTVTAVQWAYAQGLVDDETALMLLPLDIDDPIAVLSKAKEEAAQRQNAFDANVDPTIAALAQRPDPSTGSKGNQPPPVDTSQSMNDQMRMAA